MSYTREQKKIAYKKLSDEEKSFIMSSETTDMIEECLKTINLTGESLDLADLEIMFAMYRLQTLQTSISNIAKLAGKNEDELQYLKDQLQSNIFNIIQPVQEIKKDTLEKTPSLDAEEIISKELPYNQNFVRLPQIKQKLILSGVWKERTEEIAKKYSLSETQTNTLVDNVLLILIDLKKNENFLETIITELGISRLLAEQIFEDLNIRVFEYVNKNLENKSETEIAPQTIIEKTISDSEKDIPEIRPQILPATEPGKTAHDTLPTQEQIQRPLAVPRYTAVPMETEENEQPKNTSEVKPTPVEPVKRYAVDPYREPIE